MTNVAFHLPFHLPRSRLALAFAVALVAVVAFSNADSDVSAHTGDPYQIIPNNSLNYMCLQAVNGSPSSNAKIEQSVCNGEFDQKYDLIDAGGGWHQIKSRDNGLCLDVPGASTGWVQIIQWPCHSGDNQKFTVAECATGCKARILAKHSFMCFDIPGGSADDGAGVFQWHCNGGVNQDFSIHNGDVDRQKTGLPERWYHGTCTSGCSVSWMTLPFRRNVPAGLQTVWNPAIDGAKASWNTSTNTVYVDEDPPSVNYPNHDIIFNVTQYGCWSVPELGRDDCLPSFVFAGAYWLRLDKNWACPTVTASAPPPNCPAYRVADTWWWTLIATREQTYVDTYPNDPAARAIRRQGSSAHEIGHGVFLWHDHGISDPNVLDGLCGDPLPYSMMDGDCLNGLILNTVQPWDSCGVNHAYYDPNWGYAGC